VCHLDQDFGERRTFSEQSLITIAFSFLGLTNGLITLGAEFHEGLASV